MTTHQWARAVVDKFQLFIMHNSDSAIIADDDDVLTEYIAAALDAEIEECAKVAAGFNYGPKASPLSSEEYRHGQRIAAAIRQRKGAR